MSGLARFAVRVDVPATTANLGAGFDCLALALDLRNVVEVEALPAAPAGSVDLVVEGEGAGSIGVDEGNRFLALLRLGLRLDGLPAPAVGWRIRMRNEIPLSRGLGSSAAAAVAGLLAADALLGGGRFTPQRCLELVSEVEGHPDNAAAAIHGGFCVVTQVDGRARAVRLDPPVALWISVFIPERPLATAAMRAALPASVPFEDAVHNVGAASLAVAAMASGRLDLLGAATRDRLHEPYRVSVYPELPILVAAAREAGASGACLSGAGSTVIGFSDGESVAITVAAAMEARARDLALAGRSAVCRPRVRGAFVETT